MENRLHLFVSVIICLFFSNAFIAVANAAHPASWELLKTIHPDSSAETVLTIEGKLKENKLIKFDLNSLLQLPAATFEVSHPVNGQKDQYTGILLNDFLNHLGVAPESEYLIIRASNDYKVAVKINDINRYEYLLSYKKNGKFYDQLPADQNKGPLVIAINFDKHPQLDYDIYKHQLVWFVESITIK